ncbi:aldehyde dehydrogenase family protein [Thalassobacillus pellis]|uniref:aldehyde dehydrogenase family protein n=1 Tax=Thalassobacillus pellis TaxID=748008 RepID=UPI001961A84F|nr:aldehyde dehydrogenase family protein [Thalassobacillus pellis]MBM7551654.1 aldehyde dehydrogenase (NAD+) [Thalassobacillus pellis]
MTEIATATYQNYIGGEWVPSSSGETYASINPARTSEVLGYFQKSNQTDVKEAILSAREAFPEWAATPAPVRGDVLFNLIRLLEDRFEELAVLITKEVGKSYRDAKGEVTKTIQAMKQFSGEANRLTGETVPSYDADIFGYTVREPLGVVGLIAPYNFPLGIGIWKIAPAIIAGNTVVFKPASNTSLISVKIMEMLEAAGVPAGVVNMVTGPGSVVGKEFGENPEIKAVSFTGSTQVGTELGKAVTQRGGRMQAEMGGKNPTIVLEDADMEHAVESIVISGFHDNGQRCTGTSRLILLRSIADEFIARLIEKAEALEVGDGFDPGVDNGPVVDENQLNTYLHYVESAIEEGATLKFGGERLTDEGRGEGYFVAPTIFTNITPEMTIFHEEVFGPVVAVTVVDTYEEAIELANQSDFGLSSSIFTKSLDKALTFTKQIQSGVTHVNVPSNYFENQFPFGGKKNSSIGPREQGSTALDFWTETKTVYMKP